MKCHIPFSFMFLIFPIFERPVSCNLGNTFRIMPLVSILWGVKYAFSGIPLIDSRIESF